MQRIPLPKLDVRDLELVLVLADVGSTARAAASLHLTQSAVSRALLSAEEKLGTPMFERTTRGLLPTAAGRQILEGAGAVLARMVEIERVAAPPAPRRIRVVCECYTAYRWLPSTLARLREAIPGFEVALVIEATADPVAALSGGKVDIALLTTSTVSPPLRSRPLFDDEVVFVVGRSHPLAVRRSLTVDDLTSAPWLVSSATPEAEARWFVSRVFGKKRPRIERIALPLTEAIIDAASAGMGIAALSEWIAAPYAARGDLLVKRLASGPIERPWRIAFTRESERSADQLAVALAGAAPRLR